MSDEPEDAMAEDEESEEPVGSVEPVESDGSDEIDEFTGEEETDALDEIRVGLGEIHEELANSSTENRRNSRRVFEILKQFGTVLDALSATVNALHATARATAVAVPTPAATRAADPEGALGLIELSDRIDRIATAMAREPEVPCPWWPPARRHHQAWRADRERLGDSFSILATHIQKMLSDAQLERIPCEGKTFDPTCMAAVEAVLAPDLPDHTVVAELLPGWYLTNSSEDPRPRILRFAQVRVSRVQ